MARDPFPSETADRFQVRLPDGLRDDVRASAAANSRSMNSEIVARIEASGETLRDRCAMAALHGIAGQTFETAHNAGCSAGRAAEITAQVAYSIADAMLAERQKVGA